MCFAPPFISKTAPRTLLMHRKAAEATSTYRAMVTVRSTTVACVMYQIATQVCVPGMRRMRHGSMEWPINFAKGSLSSMVGVNEVDIPFFG